MQAMIFTRVRAILLLLVLNCSTDVNSLENPQNIQTKMVNLLNLCFAERLKNVITTSDLAASLRGALLNPKSSSTVVLDENFNSDQVEPSQSGSSTLILAPPSLHSLKIMLKIAKSSSSWHNNFLFFIVDHSQGCQHAVEMLKLTRESGLTSALFLCHDEDEGAMLFSYNFQSVWTLHPWEKVKTFESGSDRWSLYKQKYFEGIENCRNFNLGSAKFSDLMDLTLYQHNKPVMEPENSAAVEQKATDNPKIDCCNFNFNDYSTLRLESEHPTELAQRVKLSHADSWLNKKICCYLSRLVDAGLHEYLHDRYHNVPKQKLRRSLKLSSESQREGIDGMAVALRLLLGVILCLIFIFID